MSHHDATDEAIDVLVRLFAITEDDARDLLRVIKNVVTTDPVAEPASSGNGNWQGT